MPLPAASCQPPATCTMCTLHVSCSLRTPICCHACITQGVREHPGDREGWAYVSCEVVVYQLQLGYQSGLLLLHLLGRALEQLQEGGEDLGPAAAARMDASGKRHVGYNSTPAAAAAAAGHAPGAPCDPRPPRARAALSRAHGNMTLQQHPRQMQGTDAARPMGAPGRGWGARPREGGAHISAGTVVVMLGSGYCSSRYTTIASESGSQNSPELMTGTLPPDLAASLVHPHRTLMSSAQTSVADTGVSTQQGERGGVSTCEPTCKVETMHELASASRTSRACWRSRCTFWCAPRFSAPT
jgi:hypothetical protein